MESDRRLVAAVRVAVLQGPAAAIVHASSRLEMAIVDSCCSTLVAGCFLSKLKIEKERKVKCKENRKMQKFEKTHKSY